MANQIINNIMALYHRHPGAEYREPFFGGGAIGLRMLEDPHVESVWLNDLDIGIAAIWLAVKEQPEELRRLILRFKPTTEAFYEFKYSLKTLGHPKLKDIDAATIGFKKLTIHQISYSGLGAMSGGPLGGRRQLTNGISSRWNPKRLVDKIDYFHKTLNQKETRITSVDFDQVLSAPGQFICYLDPPYWDAGSSLYQHGFSEQDHRRLADALKNSLDQWLLSYDDCQAMRDLYNWASIARVPIPYSMRRVRTEGELLIALAG